MRRNPAIGSVFVEEQWWRDGRSYPLGHRPEPCRRSARRNDLFGHVNGRWLADYAIPADRATDGAFRLLADRAEEQVRDIITQAAAANGAQGTDPPHRRPLRQLHGH